MRNSWEQEISNASRAVRGSAKGVLLLLLVTTGILCPERAARAQQPPPPANLNVPQSSIQASGTLPVALAASGIESAPNGLRSNPTPVSTEPLSSSNSKIPNTKPLRPALNPATNTLRRSSQAFIENRGQFPEPVRFQLKTAGQTLWLTSQGIVFDAVRSKPVPAGSKKASTPKGLTPSGPSFELNPSSPLPGLDGSSFERLVFSQDFVGANPKPAIEASGCQPGIYNYFAGNDPKKWVTHVVAYSEVVYRDLWPGIDLRIHGNPVSPVSRPAREDAGLKTGATSFGLNPGSLEQEFIVEPGADLTKVQVSYHGAEGLKIAADGSLVVRTAFGEMRETQPRIYQEIAGQRVPVEGKFKLTGETAYTFEVNSYQPQFALLIDPTLLYSTFLGGNAGGQGNFLNEYADAITVDSAGSAYVTGITASTDFPTTPGAFDTSPPTEFAGFVTKFNPLGSQLVYSTYFPGVTAVIGAPAAVAGGIAVDSAGDAYFSGSTYGALPTTSNAYQTICGGASFFLTKLTPAGDGLIYSTCFGAGGERLNGIALDGAGRAYLTGTALYPFQTTSNAFQPGCSGGYCAFLAVFDPALSGTASLVYSTFFGLAPGPTIAATAVAVDAYGMAYITGGAEQGLPVTAGAYETTYRPPGGNVFVAKLNPNASGAASLLYSTYIVGVPSQNVTGGSAGYGIAVDALGNAYITGNTDDSAFPTTPGTYQTTCNQLGGGANGIFVTKLNAAGNNLSYSTYLGGCPGPYEEAVYGIGIDSSGEAYVTGLTAPGFPTTPDAFQVSNAGSTDAFVTKLNAAGSGLIYSSYLGGLSNDVAYAIAVDSVGDAYVTGATYSANFPVTKGAFQIQLNPGHSGEDYILPEDAFVTKFPLGAPQGLSIVGIAPNVGGNAGAVSPEVVGSGFHAGATIQLACRGAANISSTNLSVGVSGRIINGTFNLVGTNPGPCDLVVTNPDGTSVALPQAFTVQQGGAADVRISKIGTTPSPGHFASYSIQVSNVGNVDDTNGAVTEFLDTPFSLVSVSPPAVADVATLNADHGIVWNLPPIAAGSTQVFAYQASVDPSTPGHTPVVGGPVCYKVNYLALIECLVGGAGTCVAASEVCGAAEAACLAANATGNAEAYLACVSLSLQCAEAERTCDQNVKSAGQCIDDSAIPYPCAQCQQQVIAPGDPNNLVGTTGVGSQGWIFGGNPLQYILSFGNEQDATAPAQQVSVTVPIGPNVDLGTLMLTGINLVGVHVPISPTFLPAAGQNEFTTNVDLRPAQNLFIYVDAKFDPAKRILAWTFTSIDPKTGLPPTDPTIGFLPPGGQGNVSFTVHPTQGLATGTSIPDQGSVVFDALPATPTNTWLNTLDNTPPTSHVSSLPASLSCPDFKVSWSGSDVGSGTKSLTIFVSNNGGPYRAWLTNTNSTSKIYQGQLGHTYSFYSLAQDLVGNVEAPKTAAEATTQVTAAGGCGPPSLSGSILSQQDVSGTLTLNLQLTNTGTSDAQNILINQLSFRTLGGTGTVTLASSALPISAGNISVGSSAPVTLTLNVPATVTRFSMTEGGTLQNATGTTYNFSIAQSVSP